MKRKTGPRFYVLLLLCSNILYGQENDNTFIRYDNLSPQINILPSIMTNNDDRVILFYNRSNPARVRAIFYEPKTTRFTIRPVPIRQETTESFTRFFWDPHYRTNYGYIDNSSRGGDGWYRLILKNETLEVSPESYERSWELASPPHLKIGNSRFFCIQFEKFFKRSLPAEKITLSIYDEVSGEIVKKYSIASEPGRYAGEFFWISDGWFLKTQEFFIANSRNFETWKINGSIFNYITGEETTFAPEWIIGYGPGVILTSNFNSTEKMFTGITVWTPGKKILYRDENFKVTGIMNRTYTDSPILNFPMIDMSYFDYPYIYCCISLSYNAHINFGVVIMNLATGETYVSPQSYRLLGVFDKIE
jgi:hypothetical protein